jgi:putative membrane protein
MFGLILQALFAAAGLWLATRFVPGISADSWQTLFLAAVLLGVVNAIVRPVLVLLTLPITILTLGLFLLIINGLMLQLVDLFLDGFRVQGLIAAILGSIVVGLTSWVGSWFVGSRCWPRALDAGTNGEQPGSRP